ncbi:RHS repeat-associated core domain-containing protein [Capnocytophaga canis]|nr:RHS repeat-associated core domain-containing protein [Capnocytophaga canis]
MAIDTQGNKVWERELDIYGRIRKEFTSDDVKDRRSGFIPFLYAGQYYDKETELAYNRFRYYDPNSALYISQDPIGLAGNNPTLYGYVFDNNVEVDIFGLVRGKNKLKPNKEAGGNHSTFEIDDNGNIFKYETYEMVENDKGEKFFNPIKRFDGGKPDGTAGEPHTNRQGERIPTPHVNFKNGNVREPSDDEFPNNERFKNKNSCKG